MLNEIQDWTADIALFLSIVSVIIWAIYYKKMPKAVRYLGLYLVLNIIIQFAADYLWQNSKNNLPLLHLNTLLELIFISLFFREIYKGQDLLKKYSTPFIIVASILLIGNSIFFEPIFGFNSYGNSVVQLCIIIYVIIYFFDSYGKVDFTNSDDQAISFITFAVLLNYAGSLFIFMFGQFFDEKKSEIYKHFWIINSFLMVIFHLLILISIFQFAFKKEKSFHAGMQNIGN